MSNYVFNGKDNLDDDATHPFAGITGTLISKGAMTHAGYDGLIAMNTTFKDMANSMTEQSQHTFSNATPEFKKRLVFFGIMDLLGEKVPMISKT